MINLKNINKLIFLAHMIMVSCANSMLTTNQKEKKISCNAIWLNTTETAKLLQPGALKSIINDAHCTSHLPPALLMHTFILINAILGDVACDQKFCDNSDNYGMACKLLFENIIPIKIRIQNDSIAEYCILKEKCINGLVNLTTTDKHILECCLNSSCKKINLLFRLLAKLKNQLTITYNRTTYEKMPLNDDSNTNKNYYKIPPNSTIETIIFINRNDLSKLKAHIEIKENSLEIPLENIGTLSFEDSSKDMTINDLI